MIVTSPSPSARAASTNSFSFRVSTEPRTTRANWGTRKIALAMITLPRPVPSAAMMATATNSVMMMPPLMAARLLRIRRKASLQNPGERRRATGGSSVVADAGIEEGIGDVGEKVDEHEGGGHHQQGALHHGIVSREDALHDEPAHSGQREDRLREHGAAKVVAELESEDREDGDHGVAQGMAIHDEPVRDALGARRPHIVLAQHLQHRGARGARDHRRRGRSQHEGGQEQMREGARAPGGQPAELD